MLRLLLPLWFLCFAVDSYAEIVDERPVSTIVYGPAPGLRSGTAAASDGRDFLVAWVDAQRNRSETTRIYAARMNAGGEVLDPLGIAIPKAPSNAVGFMNTVFLGNAYLVYWNERSSEPNAVTALMGIRISRDGLVLDSAPRILASPARVDSHSAATNGNRTVIVFHGVGLTGKTIVLDRDGNVVQGPALFTNFGVTTAMIGSNGRGFLIAWRLTDALYETLLDGTGLVTTPEKMMLSSGSMLSHLASDGDGYVVILGEGTHVIAQHVSGAGELLERWIVPMQQYLPGFVFAGGSYLLMDGNAQGDTIGVRRLDRSGKPAGDYLPLAEAPSFGAGGTLASNGWDSAVFWTEQRASVQSFNGGVLRANAAALTNAGPIARSANAQYGPRAATNGRNIAVVWSESDGVYAGRLTLDGQMLDGRGIRVAGAGAAAPDIVFDGSNYLIGWTERAPNLPSSVKVTRLFPDFGTILDPAGIIVGSAVCVNAVALSAGSASTLVAWSDCKRILANTVDNAGAEGVSTTVVTPPETKETGSVSAAWNGREWLVAWEDRISYPSPIGRTYTQSFIKAARVSASLSLLDPRPISLSDTNWDAAPVVASDGNDFMVAWTLPILNPPGVMAQRISGDGSLLGAMNGVRIGGGYTTDVVWDGVQYDVAFSSAPYGRSSTLYVTRLPAAGPIVAKEAEAVVTNTVTPDAALIVTRRGHVAAAYSIAPADPIYGDVERVFTGAPHAIRARAAGSHR
jgi:hypothetical protein